MNLLELRTAARTLMSEKSTTNTYATDTDLNSFINEGIKDMCKEGVFELISTAPITTGVSTWQLPWSFLKSVSVSNPSGVPLDLIDVSKIGSLYIITGKPTYYAISQSPISYTTRAALTTYALTNLVIPAAVNGFIYECTVAGATAAGLPTYSTTPGTTCSDGTVTWKCRELFFYGHSMILHDTPTTAGGGTGTYTLVYKAMDEGLYTDTDAPNFPPELHHNLAIFACHKWAVKRKSFDLAMGFLNQYRINLGLQPLGVAPQNAS